MAPQGYAHSRDTMTTPAPADGAADITKARRTHVHKPTVTHSISLGRLGVSKFSLSHPLSMDDLARRNKHVGLLKPMRMILNKRLLIFLLSDLHLYSSCSVFLIDLHLFELFFIFEKNMRN